MKFKHMILHILLICQHRSGIVDAYTSSLTNYYGIKGTTVSIETENDSTVTVENDLQYSGYMTDLTPKDMDYYLEQDVTLQFLSQFPYGYQRVVIRNQLKHCPYTKLCGFSFNITLTVQPCCFACSCDLSTCVTYKTCCPDILFKYINTLRNASTIIDIPGLIGEKTVQKDCIPLLLSNTFEGYSNRAYGFSRCPAGTEKELQIKCTRTYDHVNDMLEVDDIVPVVNKDTNDMYRNKHCAFCHNMYAENIQQLNTSLECKGQMDITSEEDVLRAIYKDDICYITILVTPQLKMCKSTKNDCNITGTFDESACSLYSSPILVNDFYFQNIYCSFCNGIFPTSLTCVVTQRTELSFSVLMKVQTIPENDYKPMECEGHQLYDSLFGSCKNITCSEITVLNNGNCENLNENLTNVSYSMFIKIIPINFRLTSDASIVLEKVAFYLNDFLDSGEFCVSKTMIKTNTTSNKTNTTILQVADVSHIDVSARYHVSEEHNPNSITEELFKMHNSIYSFLLNGENGSVTLKFQLVDRYTQSSETHDSLKDSSTLPEEFPEIQHREDEGTYSIGPPCDFLEYDLDILELTICPKVNISVYDVPWMKSEDEIIFIEGGFKLSRFAYFFLDEDHIMVCINRYKEYLSLISHSKKKDDELSAEAVTSISVITLSISALCVTFITYCYLPKLRQSIPGKNNLSLISTLLCAQCLFMINSCSSFDEYSTACFLIGLMIHFSWLIALLWMNICTYHMFRVLARTRLMSTSTGFKRLLIYHVYAIIVASSFVIINIFISYNLNGDYGYGGETCYITSQQMLIFTFGIPVALIVFSNLTMFIIVVVKIKRSPSVQKNVKNDRNDIVVFAKLSTITGITWVFGLLYMFINSIALSYIFIILNASQGIFIMFSFIVNRRVCNMLRGKVFGPDVSSSVSGQTVSRTMQESFSRSRNQ